MRQLPQFQLNDRTAIVTGGGSGLGREMAHALAEAGAHVVVCARKLDRCEEVADAIRAEHDADVLALPCDVRDPDAIDRVVRDTRARFGRIDVLVNNAGTTWGAPSLAYPRGGWDKVLDVNLTGLFEFSRRVAIEMQGGVGGSIVNITSVMAVQGAPAESMDAVAYNASKGGVAALTRDLAVKWARHRIRVNAVAPGWFPSEMSDQTLAHFGDDIVRRIPMNRFGDPSEIRGAVVFLASAAASFVTGTMIHVDGGQTAW